MNLPGSHSRLLLLFMSWALSITTLL
jgi:hypothetical protein